MAKLDRPPNLTPEQAAFFDAFELIHPCLEADHVKVMAETKSLKTWLKLNTSAVVMLAVFFCGTVYGASKLLFSLSGKVDFVSQQIADAPAQTAWHDKVDSRLSAIEGSTGRTEGALTGAAPTGPKR